MTDPNVTIAVAIISASSAIIGAGVSSIFGWLRESRERKEKSREELRKIAITSGLSIWEHECALRSEMAKAGNNVIMPEPASYIAYMFEALHAATQEKMTFSEVAASLRKMMIHPRNQHDEREK